jgi:D-serine deaminase-like pyridoxal phosphate-dependent protein
VLTGEQLPGGLPTPATVVFADRLERKLAGMAALASDAGMALRPHAKTHKCVEIARRQLALGARGLSVATVGEAEALTAGGQLDPADVFIAYPVLAEDDIIGRLTGLARHAQVTVGADSAEAVGRLAALAGQVRVMAENAVEVAQAIDRAGLELAGIFTFPGHSYAPGAGPGAAADEAAALTEGAEILAAAGFDGLERSGGSSPSAKHAHPDALTELRPSVYVFNDAMQMELGAATMDEVALMVAATVVSRPAPGRLVLNAGSKVLGPDRPRLDHRPRPPGGLAAGPHRRPLGAPRRSPWTTTPARPLARPSRSSPTTPAPPSTWSPNSWSSRTTRSPPAGPSPPAPPTANNPRPASLHVPCRPLPRPSTSRCRRPPPREPSSITKDTRRPTSAALRRPLPRP